MTKMKWMNYVVCEGYYWVREIQTGKTDILRAQRVFNQKLGREELLHIHGMYPFGEVRRNMDIEIEGIQYFGPIPSPEDLIDAEIKKDKMLEYISYLRRSC